MKKALVIISDNNKGKFISKGFSSAFKKLSFFVYEKKIYDLDINEINKIAPDVIFIFWADAGTKINLETICSLVISNSVFIHCAEYTDEIPDSFKNKKNHYIFSNEDNNKKNRYIFSASPIDYKSEFRGYKYNITFSGNPAYTNREIILAELIKNFGEIAIFCRSFDFYKSVEEISEKKLLNDFEIELYRKSYKGYFNSTKELAEIYISSIINIDIKSKRDKEINYRLFEITSSGGFIIAPYSKTLVKQYDDGKDIETYKDIYELVDKINFYLKNTEIASMIALNGKKNTVSNFSYYDILKTMLKVIYGKDFSSR